MPWQKIFLKLKGKVWLYGGTASWHFITLPKKESKKIKSSFRLIKKGWGSVPVIIRMGKTKWKTSIFQDKKHDAYLLPIKSEIRKKENISEGNIIIYSVEFDSSALNK